MGKGDRKERELVNMFDEDDFIVMRAPSSGGGTKRELPDILTGDGEQVYAIEAKSSKGDPIYVKEKEITDLKYFSKGFNAIPLIGVRFNREPWYFFNPTDCYRTKSGNYRIKKSTAKKDGILYDDIVTDTKQQKIDEV